jgi:hypothetical protein
MSPLALEQAASDKRWLGVTLARLLENAIEKTWRGVVVRRKPDFRAGVDHELPPGKIPA